MMFKLLCYVRGDPYTQAFYVKIEEDEDVAALKKAIKAKASQTFRDFDYKSLVIWKSFVTYDKNLKENVERLDLDYNKSLKPLDSLSDIFSSELEKKSVHVIVERPPPGEFSYATHAIKLSRFQQRLR
jgi:Crinkler effector protein N-terminal domain